MTMPSPDAVAVFLKIANERFPREEDGQDLLEYGMLAALIAVVAVGAVSAVGQALYNVFWKTISINF
jgi:Flp pilus assembly pilin Flp